MCTGSVAYGRSFHGLCNPACVPSLIGRQNLFPQKENGTSTVDSFAIVFCLSNKEEEEERKKKEKSLTSHTVRERPGERETRRHWRTTERQKRMKLQIEKEDDDEQEE